eukprot:2842777-Pyramimonas_sp.AAC.1
MASSHQNVITRTSFFPLPAWHWDGKPVNFVRARVRWLSSCLGALLMLCRGGRLGTLSGHSGARLGTS